MSGLRHDLYLFHVKTNNVLFMTACFAACWFGFYADRIVSPFYFKGNLIILALFAFIYLNMAKVYDGLNVSLYRISEMIYGQVIAAAVTDAVLYVVISLLCRAFSPIWPGLLCFSGQGLVAVLWSLIAHRRYYHRFPAQKTAIVYRNRDEIEALIHMYGLAGKFDVQGYIHIDACMEDLSLLDQYQTVFLSGIHSRERNILLKYCLEKGVDVYLKPGIGDMIMGSAEEIHLFHRPMLQVRRYNPQVLYLFEKRLFDFCAALLILIITSPIMLATAIAVKSDGGPVFYKQERLTKNGRSFFIVKFRSMRVDAEGDGVARLSTGDNDDRITKVGRFIRKVRLDELPQLFNILKGDMSIVGPRPERPEIAAAYEKELPEFRLRLQAKAGLTGYAQVYGKYNTTPYDKLVMDLKYIARASWATDLRLMMATVKTLFMPDSTEGVAVGQTTAMEEKETVKEQVY